MHYGMAAKRNKALMSWSFDMVIIPFQAWLRNKRSAESWVLAFKSDRESQFSSSMISQDLSKLTHTNSILRRDTIGELWFFQTSFLIGQTTHCFPSSLSVSSRSSDWLIKLSIPPAYVHPTLWLVQAFLLFQVSKVDIFRHLQPYNSSIPQKRGWFMKMSRVPRRACLNMRAVHTWSLLTQTRP